MNEEFERYLQESGRTDFHFQTKVLLEHAFNAATRLADSKARLECERIALQYSQAYGQIDDAMAIARCIRATIKEDQS